MDMKYMRPLLVGVSVILIILLLWSSWLLYRDAFVDPEPVAATPVAAVATNTIAVTVEEPTTIPTLPPPAVQLLPTNTPPPTATPTATPIPTNTPLPTATPTAIPPTNTAAPVFVPPTNTPVPAATNTPVPVGPQPTNPGGLSVSHFALRPSRSSMTINGQVWYEYVIVNNSGERVPYSSLGVLPRRNGVDMVQWYNSDWGGPNTTIRPAGLEWSNHIKIPEAGAYTLRLVICFDGFETCRDGNGTYQTLSQEIPIQIN